MTAEAEIHEEFANKAAVDAWIVECAEKGMNGVVDLQTQDMGGYRAVMHLVIDGKVPSVDKALEGSTGEAIDWLINEVRELTAWRMATDAVRIAADVAQRAREAFPEYEAVMFAVRKAEEKSRQRAIEREAEGVAMAGGPDGVAALSESAQAHGVKNMGG